MRPLLERIGLGRRELRAWAMYDWANSAVQTTVVTVLAGPYLSALARTAVGENGVVWSLGAFSVTAKSFFPYCIALSVLLQVVLLPVLGAALLVGFMHLARGLGRLHGALAKALLVRL